MENQRNYDFLDSFLVCAKQHIRHCSSHSCPLPVMRCLLMWKDAWTSKLVPPLCLRKVQKGFISHVLRQLWTWKLCALPGTARQLCPCGVCSRPYYLIHLSLMRKCWVWGTQSFFALFTHWGTDVVPLSTRNLEQQTSMVFKKNFNKVFMDISHRPPGFFLVMCWLSSEREL